MKRKIPAQRNPFVAVAKFKKAGAHGKSKKALRRAEKKELQGKVGVVAAHRTFNPGQDEFESLTFHQHQAKRISRVWFA
jgi:hypothetical protein